MRRERRILAKETLNVTWIETFNMKLVKKEIEERKEGEDRWLAVLKRWQ